MAHQASELQNLVQKDLDDLVPYVVGGATGMQELVDDLLAYSRYAAGPTEPGDTAASMFMDTSGTD